MQRVGVGGATTLLAAAMILGGCTAQAPTTEVSPQPVSSPTTAACLGLTDETGEAAYIKYEIAPGSTWDVTVALLRNRCTEAVTITALDLDGPALSQTLVGVFATRVTSRDGITMVEQPSAADVPVAVPLTVPPDALVHIGARVRVAALSEPTATPGLRISTTVTAGATSTATLRSKVQLCSCTMPSPTP